MLLVLRCFWASLLLRSGSCPGGFDSCLVYASTRFSRNPSFLPPCDPTGTCFGCGSKLFSAKVPRHHGRPPSFQVELLVEMLEDRGLGAPFVFGAPGRWRSSLSHSAYIFLVSARHSSFADAWRHDSAAICLSLSRCQWPNLSDSAQKRSFFFGMPD